MRAIVPFMPVHVEGLKLDSNQEFFSQFLANEEYIQTLVNGRARTGLIDGEVMFCAGIIQLTQQRWQAWTFMSQNTSKHMLFITRSIEALLVEANCNRIETPVLHSFKAGHKWAELLKFENETPKGMKNYGDDGKTYDLYARVK